MEFREVLDVLPSIHPESEAVLELDPGQKLESDSDRLGLQCPEKCDQFDKAFVGTCNYFQNINKTRADLSILQRNFKIISPYTQILISHGV